MATSRALSLKICAPVTTAQLRRSRADVLKPGLTITCIMERAKATLLEKVQVEGKEEGHHGLTPPTSPSMTIEVFALELRSTTVELSSLGASILRFQVNNHNDKNGDVDIVAGYKDALTAYKTGNPVYFNVICGRVANRIAGGRFTLNSSSSSSAFTYTLDKNDPPTDNTLHGGKVGFSHKIWTGKIVRDGSAVEFLLDSPDGDQGFPGHVQVCATYSLRPSLSASGVILQLDMNARLLGVDTDDTDTSSGSILNWTATPINLTSHAYFNLGGDATVKGILDHTLQLDCDAYTPVDAASIPTRHVTPLEEDPAMEFRLPKTLREALRHYGTTKAGRTDEQVQEDLLGVRKPLEQPYGFDHNYMVRDQPGVALPRVAQLTCTQNRRHMELTIYSDAPGVQVYTANYLGANENETVCKASYGPWSAICLETQHFPDSILDPETTQPPPSGDKAFWSGKCPILTRDHPTYQQTVEYRLEVDPEAAASAYCGSDTDDTKFKSIEDMWRAQDLSSWYDRAKDWYEDEDNCPSTIDGVLGGIGHISDIDLAGSRSFLEELKLPAVVAASSESSGRSMACEMGAGIGRVTKGLLLDFVDRCDLVESSPRLLGTAPEHLGNAQAAKCRFYCSQLQDWDCGTSPRYSIVWIQWTLCYLTDKDIVKVLRRCASSLVEGGFIILKENTCADEAFVVDVDDASVTRSLPYWLHLIAESGLRVQKLTWQSNFPKDIFEVPMLALHPW